MLCNVVEGYQYFRGICFTLKMEAVWSFKMLVFYHITTQYTTQKMATRMWMIPFTD